MGERKTIHSVGIDIGTTTTQVIFSQLELVNRASASQVPQYEFSKREIIYVSPVIFTPISEDGRVSQLELETFIRAQYQAAGLELHLVESGAIIITGETSKARNARETIMVLANLLGDFVVATAGPHLESIIAGKGSGAGDFSKQNAYKVLNIDIGGGTANYAVFDSGRVIDSACLNVGGHLIEIFSDGKVKLVREPARLICQDCLGQNVDPSQMTIQQIKLVLNRMAQLVVEVVQGKPSALAKSLLMTECLKSGVHYDEIFISGGVGECYYYPERVDNQFVFGDTGPLLAEALHQQENLVRFTHHRPAQTVRATVIGAGVYTLSLSGSTIWLNSDDLPIRNVPVLQGLSFLLDETTPKQLAESWVLAIKRMDLDPSVDLYALALPLELPVSYRSVVFATEALKLFNGECINRRHPLIIIARQDFGKALGMELQPYVQHRNLAVIDEVETRDGDYVDIGKPFFGGDIVPLTVKSLAFPS